MINVYKWKKTGALFLVGLFTTIFFFVGLVYYGFWIGLATMFAGLITSYFIANMLLKNPFSDMLEGMGILAIDLNSTGIISIFIVSVDPPYIRGKLRKKPIEDNFDREAVFNLKVPKKNTGLFSKNLQVNYDEERVPEPPVPGQEVWTDSQGTVHFRLSEDRFNRAKFALMQYPVILYNSQLGTVITKDFLGDQEKTAFAEHHIMFLTQMMQSLTGSVRDFGRYIVEFLKPKKSGLGGAKLWVTIIIVVVVIILIVMFAPAVINGMKGAAGGLQGAVAPAVKGAGGAVTTVSG